MKLRNRALEKVPEMILLPHLRILDLRNNQLNSLPLAGMDRMVSLEELLLDYNRIRSLPRSLCNLGKLKVLSVRKNLLTDIPKCISCMGSLKELKLSGNELFELPVVLATIPSLVRVELDENPFIRRYPKFPTNSDQILPYLREELKAKGLPKSPRMRVVVLGADGVGKTSLIRAIQPASEGLDKKKRKRNASVSTGVAAAPSFFSGVGGGGGGAKSPAESSLVVPEGTKSPPINRERIDAVVAAGATIVGSYSHSSPNSNTSTAILTSSDDASPSSPSPPVAFLHHMNASSSFASFTMSHMGHYSSSAAASAAAAAGTGIHHRPHIDISPELLPVSVLSSNHPLLNSEDLVLNFWEFSGATTALSTHQFFTTDVQTCFIIVFNLLQPAEHQSLIEQFLYSIYVRSKDASVVLVGTHADDKRCTKEYIESTFRSIIQRTNAETLYPNLKFLYDVDTSNSVTLKGLRRSIFDLAFPESAISASDSVKTGNPLAIKVLESWLALEERLYAARESAGQYQAKKEEFFDKLIRRATGSKPPLSDSIPSMSILQGASAAVLATLKEVVSMDVSEKDLPTLIGYLNASGAVVTLKDSGHIVLDPQWLMDAASSLFTAKIPLTSKAKAGFIQHAELENCIWPRSKFPPSEYGWLLPMLEKYDVLIQVDKKSVFVPYMLPPQPPAHISSIWIGDPEITEQRRYYVFNYCPTSIFLKLLQKLLVLAEWETQVHWRYGIVMQDVRKTAQVFIFLDLETKTVKLLVRGRQQVLKMVAIAEAIELIMTEASPLKKQKYTSMVPCRHCIQEGRELDASQFPLATLEAAVNRNPANALVNCFSGKKPRTVRVDWLAPDVALSTFSGDRIEFKDIELGDTIGEGGYATVYRGKWKGHIVAVKQVKLVNIVNTEADNVFAEFRREVQLMSGLQNENLVVLKAICMEPFCMVLEFMEKGSLYELTHSPAWAQIDWTTRISLALDVARGMAFLHGMMPPIVHRDLKSPNILLTTNTPDGCLRAKVADFGLSRSLDFSRELDGSALEGNNPVWLAPEILLHQNYNEKVDVYAFGLILFEMLSGQDYFGDMAFMSDIENMVIAGKRPKIDLVEEDPFSVQNEYVELLKACWDPSPTERPTFAEAVSILINLLRKTGVEVVEEKAQQVAATSTSQKHDDPHSAADTATASKDQDTEAADAGDPTAPSPKRDMMREYKNRRSLDVNELDVTVSSGGTSTAEEDHQDATTTTATATSSSADLSEKASRRTLIKEKSMGSNKKSINRHTSTPREGLPGDSISNTGSSPSSRSIKHASDKKRPRRSEIHQSESDNDESDDEKNADSASNSTNSSSKLSRANPSSTNPSSSNNSNNTKNTLPSLGITGLSPAVRAQLSPRSSDTDASNSDRSSSSSPAPTKLSKHKTTK